MLKYISLSLDGRAKVGFNRKSYLKSIDILSGHHPVNGDHPGFIVNLI